MMNCSPLRVAAGCTTASVLETQVRRMLADSRAQSLVSNFAGQWLQLRNLRGSAPDKEEFPDFDDNLRHSFQRETELLFDSIMRENRSVVDLLTADYTFVDERLARHYGIPGVNGSRFRRVVVADEARRGLLGHGSILTITSHANRTSPVVRGKWILENLLGTPPPPPPPDVPPLDEGKALRRGRCGIGWSNIGEVQPAPTVTRSWIRSASRSRISMPSGRGGALKPRRRSMRRDNSRTAPGLMAPCRCGRRLLRRREVFVSTVTEKLMTYALGRGVEFSDMPAVRTIVRQAARDDYRWSSIVLGVVKSPPFQMRTTPAPECSREEVIMFITRRALPRRTFLRGLGDDHGSAAARRDGACAHRHGADGGATRAETRVRLCPARRDPEPMDAHVGKARLRASADSSTARAVSRRRHGRQQSREAGGTAAGPCLHRVVADRRPPKRTEGSDFQAGRSIDQIIAAEIGRDTIFPSLEVATEDFGSLIGACMSGYSCAYMNTLSWQTPTKPLPMEINPRVVFERMFGWESTSDQRLARMRADRSVLDIVTEDLSELTRAVGQRDRTRLDEYLDARARDGTTDPAGRAAGATRSDDTGAPIGVPESFEDHASLMFDLLALAFETDQTRVFTFMMCREFSVRTYPNLGVTDPHHTVSHTQNRPALIAAHAKVNTYHMQLFGEFLERLRATPDGDGSLLDHSTILYGSGMGDGNVHAPSPLPIAVVGGSRGEGRTSPRHGGKDAAAESAAGTCASLRRGYSEFRHQHGSDRAVTAIAAHARASRRHALLLVTTLSAVLRRRGIRRRPADRRRQAARWRRRAVAGPQRAST